MIYECDSVLTGSSVEIIADVDQPILKHRIKGIRISKTILKKKIERIRVLHFKTYYDTIVIQTLVLVKG